MCGFVGTLFLAVTLALWWLSSFFAHGPSEPRAYAAPLASRSFDAEHLFGYGVILYFAGYILVQLYEKYRSVPNRPSRSGNDQSEHVRSVPDPNHRARGWIAGGVIVAACTALFFLWSSDHEVPPPLSVTCRGSYIGRGRVMIITNTSDTPMYEIRVKVGDADGTAEQVADVIDSLGSKEVGWRQLTSGSLSAGQRTYVYAKGYTAPVSSEIY